jgi:hypothetical protein
MQASLKLSVFEPRRYPAPLGAAKRHSALISSDLVAVPAVNTRWPPARLPQRPLIHDFFGRPLDPSARLVFVPGGAATIMTLGIKAVRRYS